MLTDFQNFFTGRLTGKFATKSNFTIPPHPKHVATLPCDSSLITIHISDCRQFSGIHVSQGSVETCLGCGGILKFDFVANLPVSLPVKKF